MDRVNVNRLSLLEILKTNRDSHKKDYDVALTKYRYVATEKMKKIQPLLSLVEKLKLIQMLEFQKVILMTMTELQECWN